MSDQQPSRDTRWQWDDSQWTGSPSAPASPQQVPEAGEARDGLSAAVRRLLRWAARER